MPFSLETAGGVAAGVLSAGTEALGAGVGEVSWPVAGVIRLPLEAHPLLAALNQPSHPASGPEVDPALKAENSFSKKLIFGSI